MKRTIVLFSILFLGQNIISTSNVQAAKKTLKNKISIDYTIEKKKVVSFLKTLTSNEMQGRETATKGME